MDKRTNFGRGFDYQIKPCDFDKWVKYDSLPIEQACFVLLGYDPFPLEVTHAKPIPYFERRLPSWERPPGFDDALALLQNSIQNGNVQSEPSVIGQYFARQIKWPALISWAKSKRYAIPPELEVLAIESMQTQATVEPASDGPAPTKPNWRHQIQAEAREHWLRLRASRCNPSIYSICGDMAKWCADNEIKGDKGQDPKAGTIRNTVLGGGHWTPPHHSVAEAKKYVAQIAQTKAAQPAQ